jgi:hypothetical protein
MLAKSLLKSKLPALYSHKVDFFFLSILLVLSLIYFSDILGNDVILVHGDHEYPLTVNEFLFQELSNLPVHASKIPLTLTLYPLQVIFSDIAAEKIFSIMILFLGATFLYMANKQIVSRFQGTRGYWLSVSCFVGSLVFLYNPWTIDKIHHHYWLVISLAASYLLIATIDSYIHSKERKNVKQLILIGFSTTLMATQPHGPIIYFLPMLVIYLIVHLIFHRPQILSKHTAKKISILMIITIACNLFWLVPVIQALNTDRISQGSALLSSEESETFATYGIVHENVDQLSRRATIQNVLKGTSAWIFGGDATSDSSIQINNIDLWEGLAFLPLSFTFLFFFIRSPIGKGVSYITVFFVALVVLSVILATGSYYNDIYKWIFLDFPFGVAIRDPYKFVGLYFVAVSFFASASLYKLDRKSFRKKILALLLMVGLIFSWGWVGLTGDLNGHLTESLLPYPRDLADVSEYLHSEYGLSSSDAKGKIFWYPAENEHRNLKYSGVPELSTGLLPLLEMPPYMLNYINDAIRKNDTSFIPLLEYLGVHYLVIREDYGLPPTSSGVDNEDNRVSPGALQDLQRRLQDLEDLRGRLQNLKAILHENIVFESGSFGVYKLDNNPQVSVSHAISSGTDDLSKLVRVADESEYLNNIQLGPLLDNGSLIVLSDLLPPEPSEGAITIVNPTSEHHMPRTIWSSGAINGGWLNSITPYFNRFGINTWQFDYNRGSIFTWGEGSIPSNYAFENAKALTTFDFNSPDEISQWQNSRPEDQVLEHESNTMRLVLNSSNFGWNAITSPTFDVSADQSYVVTLGIRYVNEGSVQLRLTEYDKNDVIVNSFVNNIGNGTSDFIGNGTADWRNISFDFRPSTREVTSISLSIWQAHPREEPLPTVLWIDNVRVYEVPDQDLVPNSISLPFKVHGGDSNNNYKLFVRYLESPQGGLINATLEEGRLIQINTMSSHSKFVWRELGEYTLNEGTHTMTFTNEEGFNAINEILLIQKDQFEMIKGQIHDWINRNNSTAVYIFEGESDMNVADTNSVSGEEPYSGNEITFMNTTAWTQFDVKKGGDYRIWVKGSGMFSVIVGDHKEIVNATMNRPTFSDSIPLKEGDDSRLVITPLQVPANNTGNSNFSDGVNVIDSIWLVSDSSNRLHEILDDDDGSRTSPNAVQVMTTPISNNLWAPQEYEIKLNNTTREPLIISIAEPFNPNLKATIYTKDGLTKVENPLPLFYSLRTGVYIDSPAPDTRVVIYDATSPFKWFAIASFISLASYILLILLANVKLTNGFKGLICNMNHIRKRRIS